MPRPLFGFRQVQGKLVAEPDEIQVVRAVLHARKGHRISAARLNPTDTAIAMKSRYIRICRHRREYRQGLVLTGFPADPRLAALVQDQSRLRFACTMPPQPLESPDT